jgi:hypothetical protein
MPRRLVYVFARYQTDSPDGLAVQIGDGRDLEPDWNRHTTELQELQRRTMQAGTVGVLTWMLRSKLDTARKVPGGQELLFIAAAVELLEHIGEVQADVHNGCVLVYIDTDDSEVVAQGAPAPDVRRVLIGLAEHLQMRLRIEPAGGAPTGPTSPSAPR